MFEKIKTEGYQKVQEHVEYLLNEKLMEIPSVKEQKGMRQLVRDRLCVVRNKDSILIKINNQKNQVSLYGMDNSDGEGLEEND